MRTIVKIRKGDLVVVGSQSWGGEELPSDTDAFTYRERPEIMRDAGMGRRFRLVADGSFEEFKPAPTERDILVVRFNELSASDWTALADRPPMPEWAAYRQALRDITKAGDAAAMLAAFPRRPDGTDATAHLK